MEIDARVRDLVRAERRDEAIALILPAFRRKVFGLAYSYIHHREAAEDVAQDVFIKIWRALPGFDGRASLSTWIYTITRNASLSALRARKSQPTLEHGGLAESWDTMPVEPVAGDVSPEHEPEGAVLADQAVLLRMIDQLPEKQRQVVLLFYMQEQSHEEVAAMLAMPVGTVKTLLHRARGRLSTAMGAPSKEIPASVDAPISAAALAGTAAPSTTSSARRAQNTESTGLLSSIPPAENASSRAVSRRFT